ncbi:retrotransposon protein, putative, ty1-copia subclass [Tanacetum coccineum]
MVRSMMSLTTLQMSFWGYALESATRILNMVPTKKVNKTTYEMWHGKVPNLSYLKVWGYEALIKRDTPNKLESRSIKCIFVGYPKEKMGYYFYYLLETKIFVAGYAEFFETNLIKQEANGSIVEFDEIQMEDAQPSENTSLHQHEVEHDAVNPQTDVIPVCKSARIPQVHERYGFYIDAEEHELGDHGEPPNYQNLVDLPPNYKTVGSKLLFKKKTNIDGNIHTYKARLIAKGFTQTYGEETSLLVTDIKAIRILIAIAAYYDYEIWQMDVKTAFLNGRLNEDVYMVQPEGFVNPKHPGRVCKLQRSIYGLKQASRSWNKRLDEESKKYGFTPNLDEPCIYKIASGSIIVFLNLYFDDILLMGNNIPMLQDVKYWLGKCFTMKDLDLRKSQGPSTPAEVKRMKGVPYASTVGSIMYDVRCTRPDIAFSQNLTSRYQYNPSESHWIAVKNILKYLRNTKDMFLVYGGDSTTELSVTCYTDASWETNRDDLRSQTRVVFVMNKGAVDWKSSKQRTTAMSSMEVETYIDRPMDMYCDNIGAITIADEPGVQKDNNLADPFTKPMPYTKHVEHARSIGLRPAVGAVGDHRWYDELADAKLKDETLALKAKIKDYYDVLGPYANMKTEWTSDTYLDFNRIFRRNYEASNVGDTQENQGQEEHKGNPNPKPSNYKSEDLR